MTLQEYLKTLERFVDDPYGRQVRSQFADRAGKSELAVLQSPSRDEYEQLKRAVAIMTLVEKESAGQLDEQQIGRIADDAQADPALLAIFFNGFAIENKK